MELHKTSKGLFGTYCRGRLAAKTGQPRKSPYPDKRGGQHFHVITWSRTWDKYWLEGYDDEIAVKPDRYTT